MARRGARPAIRLFALLAASTVMIVAVAVRLVGLQVFDAASFERLAQRQRVREIDLPAQRGTIFDRSMRPLAISAEARALYANPRFIGDPAAAAALLAPVLGGNAEALANKLRSRSGFVYLARGLDVEVAERALALRLPGVGSLDERRRVYPNGTLAGQVLGFVGTDHEGLGGMESSFDHVLRGRPGREILEQDPRGRQIPGGRHSVRSPVPGRGLQLTIDTRLQFAAESALARAVPRTKARNGIALALDPRTGDVLAMASWPPFDPAMFAEASEDARRNRAVTDVYEPGSVNKVITAAAAIEGGFYQPSDRFKVPDRLRVANKVFTDYEPHPVRDWSYADILAQSSNVGTIKVALRLGKGRLYSMLERFGLGKRTGIEFPGESPGILLPQKDWYATSIGTIPIGQGIAATPLQVAAVYAAIANDGVLVTPRLVRGVVDRDGELQPVDKPERRRVVGSYTAAQLRSMLVGVVEEGTGRMARLNDYLVGGKTGTARKPLVDARGYSNEIITTFVGMVPADAPRAVVLVALDNPRPRFSALTAAPVWREIAQAAAARFGFPPSFDSVSAAPALATRSAAIARAASIRARTSGTVPTGRGNR